MVWSFVQTRRRGYDGEQDRLQRKDPAMRLAPSAIGSLICVPAAGTAPPARITGEPRPHGSAIHRGAAHPASIVIRRHRDCDRAANSRSRTVLSVLRMIARVFPSVWTPTCGSVIGSRVGAASGIRNSDADVPSRSWSNPGAPRLAPR